MMTAQPSIMDRYRKSLGEVEALSPEEEKTLALAWRQGDERAGQKLVQASLPFVIRVAREYRRWGIPLEDLVQQGNLGLLKAASKFEPDKECRLITYAVYWIRAEIRDYVVRGYRIVRLGTTRTERKAMRAYRTSSVESVEQLAEVSGMPMERAKKLWPLLQRSDVSADQSYEGGPTFMERIQGAGGTPEESVVHAQTMKGLREKVTSLEPTLTDRERRIMRARWMSEEPMTLEALGREMGVSKERVRQLEERLRGKMKSALSAYSA